MIWDWTRINVPLRRPYRWAKGEQTMRSAGIVRCYQDGEVGYGEVAPAIHEDPSETFDLIGSALARAGDDPLDAMPDHPRVRHGILTAWHDLQARLRDIPLVKQFAEHHDWKATPADGVPVNALLPLGDVAETMQAGQTAWDQGIRCFKLKSVGDRDADLARIEALRDRFPDALLRLDGNGSWDPAWAMEHLEALAAFDLDYVEQPLMPDDRDALQRLTAADLAPIALDESATGPEAIAACLDDGIGHGAVLKPQRLGGPDRIIDAYRVLRDHGAFAVASSSIETAVGRTAACHLAALAPGLRPAGLATGDMLQHDVAAAAPVHDGHMAVTQSPGLGFQVTDTEPLHDALATLGRGARVALWTDTNPLAVATLGVGAERGLTIIPIHARWPAKDVEQAWQDNHCDLLVTDPDRAAAVHLPTLSCFPDGHIHQAARDDGAEGHADAPRLLVATSGTTGRPRWIPIREEQLSAHAEAEADRIQHGPDAAWIACLPLSHMGGLTIVDRCRRAGARLLTLRRFEPYALAQLAASHRATHISLVPTQLQQMLEADIDLPTSLRCLLVGGDRVPPRLVTAALDRGWPVHLSYGLTEACGQVATATPEQVRADPTSSGAPLPGIRLTITEPDEDGIGRIAIDGPTVAAPLATDDLGYLDEDGALHVTGRSTERIRTRGEWVDPVQVEQALLEHPDVEDACVVGIGHPEWGQQVAAAIVGTGDENDLVAWCKGRLAGYAIPKQWRMVPELPRSELGKLKRAQVADQFSATVPT